MLNVVEAIEKPAGLIGAENDGQLRGRLWGRNNLGKRPLLLERDPVKETQGGDRDLDRTRRQPPFVRQIDLVEADVLGAQVGWRSSEIPGEPGNRASRTI